MCEICNGLPGCPVCSPEPAECPICEGEGKIFYSLDEEKQEATRITRKEYEQLPPEKRDAEPCTTCDGNGFIFDEDL